MPTTPQEVPRYCQQREAEPTALLVKARDELRTPRRQIVEEVESTRMGAVARELSVERINDVYDHPKLNGDTLWVFRSNRCIEEFAHQGFISYKSEIGPALLRCQAERSATMRALAGCVATASDAHVVP